MDTAPGRRAGSPGTAPPLVTAAPTPHDAARATRSPAAAAGPGQAPTSGSQGRAQGTVPEPASGVAGTPHVPTPAVSAEATRCRGRLTSLLTPRLGYHDTHVRADGRNVNERRLRRTASARPALQTDIGLCGQHTDTQRHARDEY